MDDAGTPVPAAYPPDIRRAQRARNFIGADLKGRYPILGGALPLCGITSPRLRGEKRAPQNLSQTQRGSPPLTRGKGRGVPTWLTKRRITPAYAGKSHAATRKRHMTEDHPRLRGEKAFFCFTMPRILGSPPLTRGKGKLSHTQLWTSRITPAYAGKRSREKKLRRIHWDHPRLRGEKPISASGKSTKMGSPPLTRGKDIPA